MTETADAEVTWVRVPRGQLEGLLDAVKHYKFAFMDTRTHTWGQGGVHAFCESEPQDAQFWLYLWFGLNHQRIKVGDTVRVHSAGDEPEYNEGEVLAVSTYAALVDNSLSGVEWEIWPLVHRMDRLHTEPDFDYLHHVPISRHMGYDVDPESAAEYDRLLAAHPAVAPSLQIVKEPSGE